MTLGCNHVDGAFCEAILNDCRNHLVVGTSWQLQKDMSGSGQGWFDEVKDFSRITECCIRSLELEQLFDICLIDFVKIFDL